jgi:alanine dehydrogenase
MIKVGITKEYKIPNDFRTPFTPKQSKVIDSSSNFSLVCERSEIRCFKDEEYLDNKISLVNKLDDCDVIFGIKEVPIRKLINNKTYFMFSHTIKKQEQNKILLQKIIEKKIRLIDYECLTENNKRIIAFGKYAGIAGAYNSLIAYGIKYKLYELNRLSHYKDTKELYSFSNNFKINSPVKIVVIGDGRVAQGAVELLESFNIEKVNINDYLNKKTNKPCFCQLSVTDYIRTKDRKPFKQEDYFLRPEAFQSNFDMFSDKTDILINAAYWDPRSPRLFEEDDINKNFKPKIIGDISCDINGAIPCTKIASTIEKPFFDYCIKNKKMEEPFNKIDNITIMSIDNLPSELPRDSSRYFGNILVEKILPLLKNKENKIIENATITKDGKLTEKFRYLSDYII